MPAKLEHRTGQENGKIGYSVSAAGSGKTNGKDETGRSYIEAQWLWRLPAHTIPLRPGNPCPDCSFPSPNYDLAARVPTPSAWIFVTGVLLLFASEAYYGLRPFEPPRLRPACVNACPHDAAMRVEARTLFDERAPSIR